MDTDTIDIVMRAYGLADARVSVISDGLMHKTYAVSSSGGEYILQELHPMVSEGSIRDFVRVTDHLQTKGVRSPRCVRTTSGEPLVRHDGRIFRLQTRIAGRTYTSTDDPDLIREAGGAVARFHRGMVDYDSPFESDLVLHRTREIHADLRAIVEQFAGNPLMTDDVAGVTAMLLDRLPSLYLPDDLPLRVVHADLKISNIIFDDAGHAAALIDLDTCNRMPLPVELGDAFRSWCGAEEDDPQNAFSLQRFAAGWEGYVRAAGDFVTSEERSRIVQGVILITLELAARFMHDHFADSYFSWDEKRYPSRRAHNLARAQGQLALYRSLEEQRDDAEMIVRSA